MSKFKMALIFIIIIAALLKSEENYILKNGRILSSAFQQIAAEMGIRNPEGIRILEKENIFGRDDLGGMAIGRAILIKKHNEDKELTIIHELVHIRQYQDLGGIYAFLKRYYYEIRKYGYNNSPLEKEARDKSEIILRRKYDKL